MSRNFDFSGFIGKIGQFLRCGVIFALFVASLSGPVFADPPFTLPPAADLKTIRSAVIRTNRGDLYVELYPEDAPWHVANFKYRADKGLYRNTSFTIFYPDYIIQGGERTSEKSKYSIPAEFNDYKHTLGALGMARMPDLINAERRSDGAQFHLLLADEPHMDGKYTIFGKVVKGLSVLQNLRKGDTIREVQVYIRKDEGEEEESEETADKP